MDPIRLWIERGCSGKLEKSIDMKHNYYETVINLQAEMESNSVVSLHREYVNVVSVDILCVIPTEVGGSRLK